MVQAASFADCSGVNIPTAAECHSEFKSNSFPKIGLPSDTPIVEDNVNASACYCQEEIALFESDVRARLERDDVLLSQFTAWLVVRRETVEAHIRKVLVQIQANALAYAMRRADVQRCKGNCANCKTAQKEVSTTSHTIVTQSTLQANCSSQNGTRQPSTVCLRVSNSGGSGARGVATFLPCSTRQCKSSKRKCSLERVIARGTANFREVVHQLKLTASQIANWSLGTRKVRRFVRRCVEVERAYVLKPEELAIDSRVKRQLTLSAIGGDVYWYDREQEGGKLRSASAVASTQDPAIVNMHFSGEARCCLKGVCFVNVLGFVLLARTFVPTEGYSIKLCRLSPPSRVAPAALNELRCSMYDSFTLCTSGVDRFVVLYHRDGIANEFRSVSGSDLELKKTRHWKINRRAKAFAWNVRCARALAMYEQRAVIFHVGNEGSRAKPRPCAVIINNETDTHFAQCELSSRGFCVIVVAHCTVRLFFVGVLRLFDLGGAPLRSMNGGSLWNVLVDPRSRFALRETADEMEICVVFVPASGGGLKSVRARSARRGFAQCRRTLNFVEEDCVSFASLSASSHRDNFVVTTEMLVELERMRTAADCDEPFVSAFAENQSALFVLDSANDAVKRCAKLSDGTFDDAQSLFRTDGDIEEGCVTGICLLDERTLILVRGNWQLVYIDAESGHLEHAVRFGETRIELLNGHTFVFAPERNRLVLGVENTQDVSLLECTRGAADWRIGTTYRLPRRFQVGHMNYDQRSRRFVLVCRDDAECGEERLSLLDDQLVETGTLPLPQGYGDVLQCFLRGRVCLVCCRDVAYYLRSFALVYDVETRTVLHVVNDRMFAAIVPGPAAGESQSSDDWPFVYVFFGIAGNSIAIQRTRIVG